MDQHRFFVHVPLVMLPEYIQVLAKLPVGLELLVDHESLAPGFRSRLDELAAELREGEVPCRFHAPFRDLRPGGHDPEAVDLARRRMEGALALAPDFGVETVVAHPAWDPQGDALERPEWLDRSVDFWTALLPALEASGCRMALENTFDRDPGLLVDLLARLPERRFGMNFDVGHFAAYSRAPLEDWFERLGDRLLSFHVHDNGGENDEHLRVGAGVFPWDSFFEEVKRLDRPLEWTVENRSLEDVLASARFLAEHSGLPEFAFLAGLADAFS